MPEWVSCEYHTAYKNAGFIDKLHEMGIKVSLWTVDTEDSVRSLLRTSADAYITNRPDRVREWVEKERRDSRRRVSQLGISTNTPNKKRDRLSRKGSPISFCIHFIPLRQSAQRSALR